MLASLLLSGLFALGAQASSSDLEKRVPLPKPEYLVTKDAHLTKRAMGADGTYNLTIIHTNDVHAHIDQYRSGGADCTVPVNNTRCYGGYSRLLSTIRSIQGSVQDSILLNAGDEAQGTSYFSYYGFEKISETMRVLNYTAFTLGNHEFDLGPDVLAAFLKNVTRTTPVISSNIRTNNTALASSLQPYLLIPQHGLAIVACTTTTTPDISQVGNQTTFENEVTAIQRTVDLVKTLPGVVRVIALTHIGYDEDIKLAKATRGFNFIVGGHSHTPLGNYSYSLGAYPTVARNLDNEEVFVVTAYRWGQHLGRIDLTFAANSSRVIAYTGAPLELVSALNSTSPNPFPQNATVQAEVTAWNQPFTALNQQIVGRTLRNLTQETCRTQECEMGNAIADAMVYSRRIANQSVDGGFTNSGGIRAPIFAGNVSRGDLLNTFPFGNLVVELTYTGAQLTRIFEGVASGINQFNNRSVITGLQISKEIRYRFNPNRANGTRLISLEIGGAPVVATRNYTIVTIDFVATGGDNIVPVYTGQYATLRTLDDVLNSYITAFTPLNVTLEGRWAATNATSAGNGTNGTSTTGAASGAVGAGAKGALGWAALGAIMAVGGVALM